MNNSERCFSYHLYNRLENYVVNKIVTVIKVRFKNKKIYFVIKETNFRKYSNS